MDASSYEKLGVFYLGRAVEPGSNEPRPDPLLYDSKDLLTHAVCVGMTGSGKTGLGIGLIEEAAIDGVPALVIDPKGDLGNLLLTFPGLEPADFEPWVSAEEARRADRTVAEFAAGQASLWREGLASWGQDGERIARLRAAADFAIFTPGSDAGIPVSVLSSFAAPPEAIRADSDLIRDRVATTVSGLLGLAGLEVDQIQDREHVLLSNLLQDFWQRGIDVDLSTLIRAVQSPPFREVGVLDLETFYPAKERMALVLALNNLIAAPGFAGWLHGVPLDIGRLLYTDAGRPRVAILSIAHLSERERMFFVSLLLNELISWMRSRPGTSSLRALLYMDEIFGFMPPVAEPPSKRPLLTLLKQARAYGLGIVLATQNPVDLDYKGLSNIGTWFVGRLQTERDKLRILEGLEGLDARGGFDRQTLDRLISGLGKRMFLLHNVHEDQPVLFQTRWVLSYLCGPLTRSQIHTLMADRAAAVVELAPTTVAPTPVPSPRIGSDRPLVDNAVEQWFLAPPSATAREPLYRPCLLGQARVHFVDRSSKLELAVEEVSLVLQLDEESVDINWAEAAEQTIDERDLLREPVPQASWAPLPVEAGKGRSFTSWRRALHEHLYRTSTLELFSSPTFKLRSEPGESEREFRIRLGDAAREQRDAEVDELRERYRRKADALHERIRKARARVEKEKQQASGQRLQAAVSIGSALLSVLTGRKGVSKSDIDHMGTAVRGVGRASEQGKDVERAEESVEALTDALEEQNREMQERIDQLEDRFDPATEELERIAVRPRKSDIDIRQVGLLWQPS